MPSIQQYTIPRRNPAQNGKVPYTVSDIIIFHVQLKTHGSHFGETLLAIVSMSFVPRGFDEEGGAQRVEEHLVFDVVRAAQLGYHHHHHQNQKRKQLTSSEQMHPHLHSGVLAICGGRTDAPHQVVVIRATRANSPELQCCAHHTHFSIDINSYETSKLGQLGDANTHELP